MTIEARRPPDGRKLDRHGHRLDDRSKGFTLIELLMAVALGAIILAALYGSFFSMLAGKKTLDVELERSREITRFLDSFTREVQSAFYDKENARTFLKGEPGDADGNIAATFSLTSFTHPPVMENRASGDLVAIRYKAGLDKERRLTVYKEVWNPYMETDLQAYKAEAVEDIVGFDVSFYNGKDWSKSWDTSLDKSLPVAVKASIRFKDQGAEKGLSRTARTFIR